MQVAFSQSKTGFGLDFYIIIIYIRIQIQAFFAGLDIVFTELGSGDNLQNSFSAPS